MALVAADSLFKHLRTGEMDFTGQRLASVVMWTIFGVAGVVGTALGYALQRFKVTAAVVGAGAVCAFLSTLFSWPCYRRNLVVWRPALKRLAADDGSARDSSSAAGSESDSASAPSDSEPEQPRRRGRARNRRRR